MRERNKERASKTQNTLGRMPALRLQRNIWLSACDDFSFFLFPSLLQADKTFLLVSLCPFRALQNILTFPFTSEHFICCKNNKKGAAITANKFVQIIFFIFTSPAEISCWCTSIIFMFIGCLLLPFRMIPRPIRFRQWRHSKLQWLMLNPIRTGGVLVWLNDNVGTHIQWREGKIPCKFTNCMFIKHLKYLYKHNSFSSTCALAGDHFVIVASDTRMSQMEINIMTRNAEKIHILLVFIYMLTSAYL